jgi:pyruvate dehydrogenase E1 component alpha subunit
MSETLLSRDQVVVALKKMLAIRKMEETVARLYLARDIGGFCHLYIGQEAIAAAVALVIREQDTMITGYRAHGFMMIKDDDIRQTTIAVVAELLGREAGCSRGKGGSMHLFDVKRGFYGGHGIVGAQVSLGTGLAFAHKYKGDDGVSFVFMGDGAANQGQVYESFNMASLWGLPCLYIIENNQYAMGTSVERGSANTDLFNRGQAFGIEGARVDGMCLLELYAAIKKAVAFCRAESRPFLLELMTYRYKGHSMSDPATYRKRAEVDDYRNNRDPIDRARAFAVQHKLMTEDEFKELDKDIKRIVDEAVEFSVASPEPDASELYTDVYA